ncbi:hypothetical protein QD712_10980 [Streptomyces acidiscabies]|uniref:hypothetical protein n=1 Tax=Streptomyces acidiscabies TaxID=42234 RepID=UPI0030CCC010
MTDVRVRVLEGPLRTEWFIGVTVLRPWSRWRAAWGEVTGVGFRRLPLAEDGTERWAVSVLAGDRSLPLVTVEDAVDADRPSRDLLEHHGRLFAPLANRGLRPEQPAERRYFDRAVGSLSVG